ASSISSRTRTLMRSDTSATAAARLSGCPLLSGKALKDHCDRYPAGKRGAYRDLGTVIGRGGTGETGEVGSTGGGITTGSDPTVGSDLAGGSDPPVGSDPTAGSDLA